MAYVAAAYLVVAGLMGVYVLTLMARQRVIAELADATRDAERPRGLPALQ